MTDSKEEKSQGSVIVLEEEKSQGSVIVLVQDTVQDSASDDKVLKQDRTSVSTINT